MENPYDYKNNIKVTSNKDGEVCVIMNKQILTSIIVDLYDASRFHREHGRYATANDIFELINAINNDK